MKEQSVQYPAQEQQNSINNGMYQHVLITYVAARPYSGPATLARLAMIAKAVSKSVQTDHSDSDCRARAMRTYEPSLPAHTNNIFVWAGLSESIKPLAQKIIEKVAGLCERNAEGFNSHPLKGRTYFDVQCIGLLYSD
jgi:hypothetical protein